MVSTKAQAKRVLSLAPDDAKIDIDTPTEGKTMITVTMTKNDLIQQKYAHLVGNPITVTQAADNYHIPRNTILEWVTKGYVTVIRPGYQMTLDNATMAYCAEAYHSRKSAGFGFSGAAPLLDQNGLPVQIKNPKMAAYRAAYRRNRKN